MRSVIYPAFVYAKRGIFYFGRRVPKDVQRFYGSPKVVLSLRTKSVTKAERRARRIAAKLEEQWDLLRLVHLEGRVGNNRLEVPTSQSPLLVDTTPPLTKAAETYLAGKGSHRPKTFRQAVDRAVRNTVEVGGDLPIGSYTRSQVNSLRDQLQSSGLATASVRPQLSTLSALVNYVSKELGLDPNPAFSGVIIHEVEVDAESQKRPSVPIGFIKAVQQRCYQMDDEARWAVALVSDTGLRLSEALGLVKDDVILDDPVPHLVVRSHPWRRLKTSASARKVPLVGAALWAAQRASALSPSPFMFPRYCSPEGCKGNSASGALNKWLKPLMPEGCVIHSFRHSFRDRLRAVQCPKDITDRLGGWSVSGVGESYGEGYPLEVLAGWVQQLAGELQSAHQPLHSNTQRF